LFPAASEYMSRAADQRFNERIETQRARRTWSGREPQPKKGDKKMGDKKMILPGHDRS
jgi:hypothetical protein